MKYFGKRTKVKNKRKIFLMCSTYTLNPKGNGKSRVAAEIRLKITEKIENFRDE